MLVELDIFSGRPNPSWELDEPSIRRLREVQRGLPEAPTSSPKPLGLGYRGFVYRLDGTSWRALHGTVIGTGTTLHDPDRLVERLLFDSLPPAFTELRGRIAAEIDRPT